MDFSKLLIKNFNPPKTGLKISLTLTNALSTTRVTRDFNIQISNTEEFVYTIGSFTLQI